MFPDFGKRFQGLGLRVLGFRVSGTFTEESVGLHQVSGLGFRISSRNSLWLLGVLISDQRHNS